MKQSTLIKNTLESRQADLKKLISKLNKEVVHAPAGALRIQNKKGISQYYWRQNAQDRCGRYLKKSEFPIVQALAQKGYAEKLIASAENENKAIQKFLDDFPPVSIEDVFEQYRDDRKNIITPIYEPDDLFVAKWTAVEYPRKPVEDDVARETDNGELVRSKSELIIANTLKKLGIPYRYEFPLRLKGASEVIHPDFYVLNVRLRKVFIFEHFGMIDSIGYSERMIERIRLYSMNGIFQGDNFVFTFETKSHQLRPSDVELLAKHYFL